MEKQASFDVAVIGGNADGLTLAANLAESGSKVLLLEPGMKLGGELLTESFLTSHRYNLSGGWQLAETLAPLGIPGLDKINQQLLFPDIPFAFLFDNQAPLIFHRSLERLNAQIMRPDRAALAQLIKLGEQLYTRVNHHFSGRQSKPLSGRDDLSSLSGMTVKQLLDELGFVDVRLRCALSYLPLALGCDIEVPGTAAALVYVLFGISKISVVDGGSGLLANNLADRLIVKQGLVIESAKITGVSSNKDGSKSIRLDDGRSYSASSLVYAEDQALQQGIENRKNRSTVPDSLGVYRIYLDLLKPPAGFEVNSADAEVLKRAYMVGFGFNSEDAIYHYLKMIRAGQPPFIAGHLLNNSFLDASDPHASPRKGEQEFWCTSCHTADVAQLKKQAGKLKFKQGSRLLLAGMSKKNKAGELLASGNGLKAEHSVAIRPAPGSFTWQGIIPQQLRALDVEGFRKSFERACIERISQSVAGMDVDDVRFKLTWLAHETREPLIQMNMLEILKSKDAGMEYTTTEKNIYAAPYHRLSRFTGLHTGLKLTAVMKSRLAQGE